MGRRSEEVLFPNSFMYVELEAVKEGLLARKKGCREKVTSCNPQLGPVLSGGPYSTIQVVTTYGITDFIGSTRRLSAFSALLIAKCGLA
jgi:hypothetical protein